MNQSQKYATRLMIRSWLVIALLASLSFAEYQIIRERIQAREFDAALINISGKQRVLFERSAILARYLINAPDDRERSNIREQLVDTMVTLEQYKEALLQGDKELNLPGNPPPQVKEIYFKPPYLLETRLSNYLSELKLLSSTRDSELSPNDIRLQYIHTVSSGKVRMALDAVVNEFQKQSEIKIEQVQRLEHIVLFSMIFALLISGFFVFRPMINQIRHKMTALENLNTSLETEIEAGKIKEEKLQAMISQLAVSNQELDHVSRKLAQANEQLEELVIHDPLTSLLNRRGLQQALSSEIHRMRRNGSELHGIIVDLDDFKTINDTLGYAVGDVVIKEVAAKLKASLRATDQIARIGGDEFIVLMPQIRQAEALLVAEKLRLRIAGEGILLSSGSVVRVTASFGVVQVAPDTASIDSLLNQTNLALMHSKKMGKDQVSYGIDSGRKVYSAHSKIVSAQDIPIDIHQIEKFKVLKQPIIELDRLTTVGYEFLSRSSIQGFEMPDDFFRMCLEKNILTLVDHQCLKNCISAANALRGSYRFHLNLFPSTIINIPTEHLIETMVQKKNEKRFCIEISEQQIIGDPSHLIEPVNQLKRSDVLIAVDDVGFGKSCLESLILLEPDIIKLDKKCVINIAQDKMRMRSLKQLLKISDVLEAEVIAEGIESEQDLEVLREFGVRLGQGYFFGRPQ